MSYCYDVMARAWETLREQLPPETRDGILAERFGFLIAEMHEANHRLKDVINHDEHVHAAARRIDSYTRIDPGTGRVKPLTDDDWPKN